MQIGQRSTRRWLVLRRNLLGAADAVGWCVLRRSDSITEAELHCAPGHLARHLCSQRRCSAPRSLRPIRRSASQRAVCRHAPCLSVALWRLADAFGSRAGRRAGVRGILTARDTAPTELLSDIYPPLSQLNDREVPWRKRATDRLNDHRPHEVKPAPIDIAGMKAGEPCWCRQHARGRLHPYDPGRQMPGCEDPAPKARTQIKAEVTRPITMGYHLRTVAEAAREAHQAVQSSRSRHSGGAG